MKALEFIAKIKNNRIEIPKKLHKQVISSKNSDVRVIVLMEDNSQKSNDGFSILAREKFLKGYSKSDSVYDNY